ncbi:MAG: hypothetical protein WAT66_03505 [Actinomycetota bacterium]
MDRWLPEKVDQTPGRAEVTFEFRPRGEVTTRIRTAERPQAELVSIGREVAVAAFPGRPPTVEIDGNSIGPPIIRATTRDGYVPGPHPIASIDAQGPRQALARYDIAQTEIHVCPAWVWTIISPPRKVRTTGDCVRTGSLAASIAVEMKPRPERMWRGVLLTALPLATAILGLAFLRRRPRGIAIAAPCIGFAILVLTVFWAPSNDEIYVAGRSMPFAAAMNGFVRAIALAANAVVLFLLLRKPPDQARVAHSFPPPPPA